MIEDPINMSINVAHSCFGFPQIQWLFSNLLSALQLRGPEMIGYDKNADLLQLLGSFWIALFICEELSSIPPTSAFYKILTFLKSFLVVQIVM